MEGAGVGGRAYSRESSCKGPGQKGAGHVRTQKTPLAPLLSPLGQNPTPHPGPEASHPFPGRPQAFPVLRMNETSQLNPAPKLWVPEAGRLALGVNKTLLSTTDRKLQVPGLSTQHFHCGRTPPAKRGAGKPPPVWGGPPLQPPPHSHKGAQSVNGEEELSPMTDRLAGCSSCPHSHRPDTRPHQ